MVRLVYLANDLYCEMQAARIISLSRIYAAKYSRVVLVFGQMNETPGARMRVSFSALAMAEYSARFSL